MKRRHIWMLIVGVLLVAALVVGSLRVKLEAPWTVYTMYVPKHDLATGSVVSPDDFYEYSLSFPKLPADKEKQFLQSQPDMVTQLDFSRYIGWRLVRPLPKGKPLKKSTLGIEVAASSSIRTERAPSEVPTKSTTGPIVPSPVGDPTSASAIAADSRETRVTEEPEYVVGPYPVLDSGMHGVGRTATYWLDEHRVLFTGVEKADKPTKSRYWKEPGIRIWDIATGKIETYAWPVSRGLCYSDGTIRYGVSVKRSGNTLHYMQGPMGREQEHTRVLADKPWEAEEFSDWINCRTRKYSDYGLSGPTLWIVQLRDGDGYLEFGDGNNREGPARYYAGAEERPKIMPFTQNAVTPHLTRYFEFRKAYFLLNGIVGVRARTEWTRTGCLQAWWLIPRDGTEEICIPVGPWTTGADWTVLPTERGLFLASNAFNRDGTPGVAGAYLLANGSGWRKLISGFVDLRSLSVSDEGCRVAFAHSPDLTSISGLRVKAMNLCESSRYGKDSGR